MPDLQVLRTARSPADVPPRFAHFKWDASSNCLAPASVEVPVGNWFFVTDGKTGQRFSYAWQQESFGCGWEQRPPGRVRLSYELRENLCISRSDTFDADWTSRERIVFEEKYFLQRAVGEWFYPLNGLVVPAQNGHGPMLAVGELSEKARNFQVLENPSRVTFQLGTNVEVEIEINSERLPARIMWLVNRPDPAPDTRYESVISEWKEWNGHLFPWRYESTMYWNEEFAWSRSFRVIELLTGQDALSRYPTGLGEAETVWEINNITGAQHHVPGKYKRLHGSTRVDLSVN